MKIPLLFALATALVANALVACAQAETPATGHRADPRLAAEIQQANLLVKSFPATNPDLAKNRADIPAWWQSTLDERDSFLSAHVKKGEVINYGTSAGGRPLRAVVYGKARTGHGTTTANGAISFGDIRVWLGPDHGKRVALVFSAIHGGEFEGIVGTMNFLAVLETGVDLAGRPIVPNLDTVINLHAGTLCTLVESPSHSFGGKRRDGTPAPTEPLLLLDAHLRLFTDAFDYLADTGGLAVWTATSKAR